MSTLFIFPIYGYLIMESFRNMKGKEVGGYDCCVKSPMTQGNVYCIRWTILNGFEIAIVIRKR